jgi:hypothetical protein
MTDQIVPDYPCDGTYPNPEDVRVTLQCPNRVAGRRLSTTGKHFCPDRRCQAAKQRFYRQHRVEQAKLAGRDLVQALIVAIMENHRSPCAHCDHPNALVGWAHPDGQGGACRALGPLGPGLPPGLLGTATPR